MADSTNLFTLLETATGYLLFEVVAFEEIGSLLEGSINTVTSLSLFSRAVKLKAFQPFASAEDALNNANALSEHSMTSSLKYFLEMNLPKVISKKKKTRKIPRFSLGVIDASLATAISEGLPGLFCRSDDTIREIVRGCRLHIYHFVKGLTTITSIQAQLGLGHSYSRSKVKFNPARSDNMIIQTIALLDLMDKDLNSFSMRVKEWYSWHFPELKDIVKDNHVFARCASFIQDKKTLFSSMKMPTTFSSCTDSETYDKDQTVEKGSKDTNNSSNLYISNRLFGLTEICGDEGIAKDIIVAAKTSMGMDCSPVDMINIVNFTQRMVRLAEFRQKLSIYLADKMKLVAPNLSTLLGDTVAARLISKAGSLTNLAKAPASTVQILGAEKALFRALKTKGNTPKYGLLYHSTFIGRADSKNKGRISRYLANKCSIATRIDSFSEEPTTLYGEKLRDQVEERLLFYQTGAGTRKNVDVMVEITRDLKRKRNNKSIMLDKYEKEIIGANDNIDKEQSQIKISTKKEKKKKKKGINNNQHIIKKKRKTGKDMVR